MLFVVRMKRRNVVREWKWLSNRASLIQTSIGIFSRLYQMKLTEVNDCCPKYESEFTPRIRIYKRAFYHIHTFTNVSITSCVFIVLWWKPANTLIIGISYSTCTISTQLMWEFQFIFSAFKFFSLIFFFFSMNFIFILK